MANRDFYTIGEVAAILGVSTHTIRAWERRHGIVRPERTRTRQRRYRDADVELLRDVKRAVEQGGLSLKLAFESVTGARLLEAPSRGVRRRPDHPLPATADVWRGVADVVPELIFLVDSEGRIVETNVAVAKAVGSVIQRLKGMLFANLIDPFDRSKAVLLYRPRLRTVDRWELNVITQNGTRLYSFRSWTVQRARDIYLAMVASELASTRDESDIGDSATISGAPDHDVTAASTFPELVDQLPFGVAVISVGAEPRVVYANVRLSRALGIPTRIHTGRAVGELLPDTKVARAIRRAVSTNKGRRLRSVWAAGSEDGDRRTRRFDVELQPLMSSARKVASVMLVVEESGGGPTFRKPLERMVADHRFETCESAAELADVAMEHLAGLVPGTQLAIGIFESSSPQTKIQTVCSAAAEPGPPGSPALIEFLRRAVGRAAAQRSSSESTVLADGRRMRITAVPVSSRLRLGAVAWSIPPGGGIKGERRKAVDVFISRLAAAAELLQLRSDSAKNALRYRGLMGVAAVVRNSAGPTGLGARFLAQLAKTVQADGAAIGRIEASHFVVEAAYAAGGVHAKPGDRFPLSGQFVSASLQSGKATESKIRVSKHLPERVRTSLRRMKHALSVPLVTAGRVTHVITLLRLHDRPFDEEDLRIVKAMSGVALLTIGLGSEARAASDAR